MAGKFKRLLEELECNKPKMTPDHPTKKAVVKGCDNGKEKIIRLGAKGYKNNYSPEAKSSFRARHGCDEADDKLSARKWACSFLWPKNKKGW